MGCGFRADEMIGVHYSYTGTGLPAGVSPPCLGLRHDSFQLFFPSSFSFLNFKPSTHLRVWAVQPAQNPLLFHLVLLYGPFFFWKLVPFP